MLTLLERIKNFVNVEEKGDLSSKYEPMTFDLPKGMELKHINVSVDGDVLTVKGDRRVKIKNTGEKRYYGFLYNEYAPGVSPENVTTSVKDGVLTVTVQNPKQE